VLKRIDTGTTRVAFNHDDDMADNEVTVIGSTSEAETKRAMEQWHLDHIVYTSLTLVPTGKWSTLEDDEYSAKVGLPNVNVPTDHLPIAASFQLQPHPRLDDEVRSKLFADVEEMEQRQNAELESLQADLDKTRTELEQKNGPKNEDHLAGSHATKKAKKKPAPEIIEHIRSSRAVKKELKVKHRTERYEFIKDLAILKRMELQLHLKGSCRKWAENGR
jgi:hypothetical protein